MANEKGLYWLALGVVALMLVNGTGPGRQDWLGRLADRSIQVAERLSGRTMSSLSLAEMRLGSRSYGCARTHAAATGMQRKFACMEGAMARQEAEFARIQAERSRLEALHRMGLAMMPQEQGFAIAAPKLRSIPTEGTI